MTATSIPATGSGKPRWVLSVLSGTALFITVAIAPRQLPHIPFCWFYSITGLPCPDCGLTRSVFAIGSGEFLAAWHFNPFGYLVYGILVVLALLPLLVRVAPRLASVIESSRFVNTFATVSIVSLLVYGLIRMALHLG